MQSKIGCLIGVCNWSLKQPVEEAVDTLRGLGVSHVHLGVKPALGEEGERFLRTVRSAGWTITSAMIGFAQESYQTLDSIRRTGGIVPDECWPVNRDVFCRAADVAAAIGTSRLAMHAGFLDPTDPRANGVFSQRMTALAEEAERRKLTLLMETGQETAEDLRSFLETVNHPALAVNFDPANMLLYGKGDPIKAVSTLAPWIRHVHIKDAVASGVLGQWGRETPWGDGSVGAEAFLRALQTIGYRGPLAIEREGGENRLADIRQAISRLTAG